jgi:hypothetical protein
VANGGHTLWCLASSAGYWTTQSFFSDTLINVCPGTPPFGFDICSLIWSRPTQDNVQIDLAFAKVPATGQLTVLDPAVDMAGVETALTTWWTTVKGQVSSDLTLLEYAWHQYLAGALKPGPAVRVTPVGAAGTNGGFRTADQVAMTTTFRTASRKHWGRTYQPGLTVNAHGLNGFFGNTSPVDTFAGAYNTLWTAYNGSALGIVLGVASIKYAGFLRLSTIAVDNIPDVQRRRRIKHPTYERVYT